MSNTCKSCRHWEAEDNLGACFNEHFVRGYHVRWENVKPDEMLVEDDEGWAFFTGPDFGCIHHEAREGE